MNNNKNTLLTISLFLVIIFLFFFKVIFGNKTLLSYGPNMYPENNVNQPYLSNTVQDEVAPAWLDVPYSAINHSLLRKYKLPLWNQYSAIGYPLSADMESSSFFPLHLPSLLGLNYWDLYLVLRPILAMIFLYLFLRELQLKTIPSILGAFLYCFSGYFVYYLNNFNLNVDMLIPSGLFFVIRFFKHNTFFNFIGLIITYFLILNGGNPQAALLGLALINSYYFYLVLTEKGSVSAKSKEIANLVLINFISACLSAYNYLPFLELYNNAWTIHPDGLALKHMELIATSNFIFPYLIGYLKGAIFTDILSTRIIPYFGILPTWLILVSLISHKHRRHIIFFLIIIGIWFLKLTGFPYFESLLKLPIITNIWFNKYVSTLFLSASILAAMGADSLTDFFITVRLNKIKNLLQAAYPLVLALALFMLLQIIGNYLGLNTKIKDFLPNYIDVQFILNNASHQRLIGNAFFKWERVFLLIAILLSIYIIIHPFKKYIKRISLVFSVAILLLIVAEYYLYFPQIRSSKFNPAQTFPYIDYLKKDKSVFRIYGTEQTAMAQENLFFEISDIRIVSPLLYSRYASFFRELLISQPKEYYHPYLGSRDITMGAVNNNLLSLLNVKYVLSNNYFPTQSIYKLIYDNELKIYKNKNVMSRVFLVDRIVSGMDKQQIFSYLKSDSFQPHKEAVVEGVTRELMSIHNDEIVSTAVIKQYESDMVSIDVLTNSPKLLVLSDLYYPGWQVYVDGKEELIYRTNYIMRGVFIPKGHHVVKFIYRPQSFLVGAIISLLIICFTVVVIKVKLIKLSHD